LPASFARKVGTIEFSFEWLRAEPGQQRVLCRLAALDIVEQTEATVRRLKANNGCRHRASETTWSCGASGKACAARGHSAGHAEVEQQQAIRIELDQDVLPPAAEGAPIRGTF